MPLYEYQCDACGARFEAIRKFSDPPLETCAKCGVTGQVQKLISSPAFHLKGSGWYATDYAKKSGDSGSAAGKSDDKPAAKTESKPEAGKDAKETPASTSSTSDKPAAPAPAAATSTTKDK